MIVKFRSIWLVSLTLFFIASGLLGCSAEAKKERHWKKGERYLSENKYRDAVIEFKNVVKIDPDDVGGHLQLGKAHLSTGEFREAYAQFLKCVQMDPAFAEARIQLGKLYLMARKYKEAREQAEAALAGESPSPEGHLLMSMIHMAQNRPSDALKEAQEAVNAAPKSIDALLHLAAIHAFTKNLTGAKQAVQRAIDQDPRAAAPHVALARIYISEKDFTGAEAEFIKALESNPGDVNASLRLGDFYMSLNRKDKGISVYKKIVETGLKSEPALVRLAENSLNEGKLQEGSEYVEKILKSNPKSAEGQLMKGRIHLTKREFDEAILYIQPFCKDYPKSAPGRYYLALAHFGNKDLKQAQTHASEAVRLRPRWIEPRVLLAEILMLGGSHAKALAEINRVLEQAPLNSRAILMAGDLHVMNKNITAAEKILRAAVKRAPDIPAFHVSLGKILLFRKQEKEALAHFEEALELRPGYIEPLRMIVTIHLKNKSPAGAIAQIEKQMKMTPPNPMYDFLLARVFEVSGDAARSETHYRKAAGSGNFQEFYNALAGFYIRKGLLQKAEKQYMEALRMDPKAYAAHMGLGLVYESMKDKEKAKDHYRKALNSNPKLIAAANNLAYLYAEEDDKIDEALNLAQSAKETAPQDPYISDTLGWIYYKKNIFSKAIPYLKEANEKIPGNPVFRYHLGMAYYKNGNLKDSERELTKAVALNPNLPEKSAVLALLDKMGKTTPNSPVQRSN